MSDNLMTDHAGRDSSVEGNNVSKLCAMFEYRSIIAKLKPL